MNYSTHRIRYYAPISHKGRARQIGMKADGTWQQKCSKDWIDSDEYLREALRCGLKGKNACGKHKHAS
jgi:hypothetical protein